MNACLKRSGALLVCISIFCCTADSISSMLQYFCWLSPSFRPPPGATDGDCFVLPSEAGLEPPLEERIDMSSAPAAAAAFGILERTDREA